MADHSRGDTRPSLKGIHGYVGNYIQILSAIIKIIRAAQTVRQVLFEFDVSLCCLLGRPQSRNVRQWLNLF